MDRIAALTKVFAVDVLAYAIMSNHYHLVVRIRPEQAQNWSSCEVIERWSALHGVPAILSPLRQGDCSEDERSAATTLVEQRRHRLGSLSWFMKCLNENIARRANREDECTRAFWEGRFKSQALLDESALLACMAYVDLNPIRAGVAVTPAQSDYTSIQARMTRDKTIRLAPFCDQTPSEQSEQAISFKYMDYLNLLDWTAQIQRCKRSIPRPLPRLLYQSGLTKPNWLKSMKLFQSPFLMIGSPTRIRAAAERLSRKWFRGVSELAFFVEGLRLDQRS